MRILLLVAALALPGCARIANSPINPLNWFGGPPTVVGAPSRPAELRPLVSQDQLASVIDSRVPIERIDAVTIERTATGGLVTATGTAASQGHYNAELVPVAVSGGTLVYSFRVETPPEFEATGAPPTRRITAAADLDAGQFAALRVVRVEGRTNAQVVSR